MPISERYDSAKRHIISWISLTPPPPSTMEPVVNPAARPIGSPVPPVDGERKNAHERT